jgi:hypothetical protein
VSIFWTKSLSQKTIHKGRDAPSAPAQTLAVPPAGKTEGFKKNGSSTPPRTAFALAAPSSGPLAFTIMFETTKSQLANAAEKLAHLRRFL